MGVTQPPIPCPTEGCLVISVLMSSRHFSKTYPRKPRGSLSRTPSGQLQTASCLGVNKRTVFCRNIQRYWISRRLCRSISCAAPQKVTVSASKGERLMTSPMHTGEGDIMPHHIGIQRVHGYCGLCRAACGTVATVDNGRFTRLDPDPSHPTGQALCAKGRAAPELVYHPERLTHPLRRTRPKGDPDPGWVPISWDDALDETAAAMRRVAAQYGPASVAVTISSPSTTSIGDSNGFIRRLMNAFGTPNASFTLDICGWGRAGATSYTYGVAAVATGGGGAMPDIENTGCLILWGYNPSNTRLTHATATVEAQKRGMRLIVIDPRHAGLANKAD